jgi:prepilin-type N-terminal cleavage/methylation domain-containing protein
MAEGVLMRNQRGFTLVEVILALTILLVVMMMLARTTGQTVHTAATSANQQAAMELAMDRVEQVRADPNYDGLEAAYAKTETGFPTLPGFTRVTAIVRTGGVGQPNDYKKVTVTVSGPGVLPVITRTVTVAAP